MGLNDMWLNNTELYDMGLNDTGLYDCRAKTAGQNSTHKQSNVRVARRALKRWGAWGEHVYVEDSVEAGDGDVPRLLC